MISFSGGGVFSFIALMQLLLGYLCNAGIGGIWKMGSLTL